MADCAFIGLDWGTTSLRAYRVALDGGVLELRGEGPGILAVADADFARALHEQIDDWLTAEPSVPVVASGMITSRQGWREVPYVACPAGAAEIASGVIGERLQSGHTIAFVPGLVTRDAAEVPDVMRGEETQILGACAGAEGPRVCVLPGTHSKWALWHAGRIESFATFMTGELFAVLSRHSILGRLMVGDSWDEVTFARGVDAGSADAPGGLLRRLFSARTLPLMGDLPEAGTAAYLSGLLIGAELREALAELPDVEEVLVIGSDRLARRYGVALERAGLSVRAGPPDAVVAGQLALARRRGLVP